MPAKFLTTSFAVYWLLITLVTDDALSEVLINSTEAKLPPSDIQRRAIFLGPVIQVISPSSNGERTTSPLHLKVRFQSRAGSNVDIDTLVVTYMSMPTRDLTERVLPFARQDGIDIPRAEVPPGRHRIWIEVKDTNNRLGWAELNLDVAN